MLQNSYTTTIVDAVRGAYMCTLRVYRNAYWTVPCPVDDWPRSDERSGNLGVIVAVFG